MSSLTESYWKQQYDDGEYYLSDDGGGFRPPVFLMRSHDASPPQEIHDLELHSFLVAYEDKKRDERLFALHTRAQPQSEKPAQPVQAHKERPVPDNVRQFVLKHYQEAQTLATSLGNGVTAAEVLAVSGNETHWGSLDPKDGFARFGNFFGLHGHGPAGTYYTTKNHKPVEKFQVGKDNDGFLASGQVFVQRVRPLMTNDLGADPKAFFEVLNKAHLYADGNPNYAAFMVCTADGTCPGYPSGTRGPYTMVIICIKQLKQEGKL